MLFWKLKGIIYILRRMTPSWKEIISKKYNCIFKRLNVFDLFLQMNHRIFWVRMMAHHVSFKAIET